MMLAMAMEMTIAFRVFALSAAGGSKSRCGHACWSVAGYRAIDANVAAAVFNDRFLLVYFHGIFAVSSAPSVGHLATAARVLFARFLPDARI